MSKNNNTNKTISNQQPFTLTLTPLMCHLCFQPGAATTRPEDELERLTKKLVYDMNHPPVEDYFGTTI